MVIFLVAYVGGLCVKYNLLRVNYTRKINHFFLFFTPSIIDKLFVTPESSVFWLNEGIFFLGSFIIFVKPVRERIFFIATAFSSFDRPEDRPYTLTWYIIQEIAGYLVVMPAINIFQKYNMLSLLSIPILISVIGDGLAEPVGIRFGKHRYLTHAVLSKKKYLRTLEGSFMVFITSVVVVLIFHQLFNPTQLVLALLTVPITATLAEALSPHTLDNPLITLVGFANILLIKQLF
jgi:phytol kinase